MWKLFSQNESDPVFYLKVETLNNENSQTLAGQIQYKITVTNYIKMWYGTYDTESMIQMMLDSNKGIEVEDKQAFLDIGLQMLHDPKMLNEKVLTETSNGNINVRLLCKTPIVLKMNFTLKLSLPEQFFQSITRPLLEVVHDLQNSEKKLRLHLIKKDGEIRGFMDMVPEGSPLMRCLRTEPYNDAKHMKVHSAADKLFGLDPVEVSPKHILQYGQLFHGTNDVEKTPTNSSPITNIVKKEPSSVESLSLQHQIQAIKSEPTNNTVNDVPPNNALKSDLQNTMIKSESNDDIYRLGTKVKIENDIKNVLHVAPKDDTNILDLNIKTESRAEYTTDEKDANKNINSQRNELSIQINNSSSAVERVENASKINEPKDMNNGETSLEQIQTESSTKVFHKAESIREHESEEIIIKRRSHSPVSITERKQTSTPKKRRKNLNY